MQADWKLDPQARLRPADWRPDPQLLEYANIPLSGVTGRWVFLSAPSALSPGREAGGDSQLITVVFVCYCCVETVKPSPTGNHPGDQECIPWEAAIKTRLPVMGTSSFPVECWQS